MATMSIESVTKKKRNLGFAVAHGLVVRSTHFKKKDEHLIILASLRTRSQADN